MYPPPPKIFSSTFSSAVPPREAFSESTDRSRLGAIGFVAGEFRFLLSALPKMHLNTPPPNCLPPPHPIRCHNGIAVQSAMRQSQATHHTTRCCCSSRVHDIVVHRKGAAFVWLPQPHFARSLRFGCSSGDPFGRAPKAPTDQALVRSVCPTPPPSSHTPPPHTPQSDATMVSPYRVRCVSRKSLTTPPAVAVAVEFTTLSFIERGQPLCGCHNLISPVPFGSGAAAVGPASKGITDRSNLGAISLSLERSPPPPIFLPPRTKQRWLHSFPPPLPTFAPPPFLSSNEKNEAPSLWNEFLHRTSPTRSHPSRVWHGE